MSSTIFVTIQFMMLRAGFASVVFIIKKIYEDFKTQLENAETIIDVNISRYKRSSRRFCLYRGDNFLVDFYRVDYGYIPNISSTK